MNILGQHHRQTALLAVSRGRRPAENGGSGYHIGYGEGHGYGIDGNGIGDGEGHFYGLDGDGLGNGTGYSCGGNMGDHAPSRISPDDLWF